MVKIICLGLFLCICSDVIADEMELGLTQWNITPQNNANQTTSIVVENRNSTIFTKWTSWSRCEYCLQRRTKKCISPKCKQSRIYEERPCNRRRCQRKRRRKQGDFRVLHVGGDMQRSETPANSIWSKWSKWSKCSKQCRTFRVRTCKKPGRCKKNRQRQTAFCYLENTHCEEYVLNLLDSNNSNRRTNLEGTGLYHYHKQENRGFQLNTNRSGKCGRPRKKAKMLKIIGGTEAKKYKWPWHVAVINRYGEVFCAGALVASRWILTAGHCVRSYLRVRLNEHDLNAVDGRELEMVVQKMFLHPRFNHQTVDNDIALLRLPRNVKIPPVCLPLTQPKPEKLCYIMGWGKLNNSDEYGTNKLHEAKIPIVNWNSCTKAYRRYLLTPNMFCAGWTSGAADTCAGDSGGGLMCPTKRNSKTKAYSIQGITSFGDGCGMRNKFGIYTNVYNYLGWIKHIIVTYS